MYGKKPHQNFPKRKTTTYQSDRDHELHSLEDQDETKDTMLQEVDCSTTYHVDDILAITIAPDDNLQFNREPKRYNKFYEIFDEKLKRLFYDNNIPYYFVIELTEPIGTKIRHYPRLHLHGVIQLRHKFHIFKFLVEIISDFTLNCMLEIKHTTDVRLDGWDKYIHKQQYYMPTSSILTSFDDYKSFYETITLPRGALQSVSAGKNGECLAKNELQSDSENGREASEAFTRKSKKNTQFKLDLNGI